MGAGAAVSAVVLVAAPDGHLIQMPIRMLRYSPFSRTVKPKFIKWTSSSS